MAEYPTPNQVVLGLIPTGSTMLCTHILKLSVVLVISCGCVLAILKLLTQTLNVNTNKQASKLRMFKC